MGEALEALASGEEEDGRLIFREGGEEFFTPEGPDFRRGEDEGPAGGGLSDESRNPGEEVAADGDGVVGGRGFYADGAHRLQGTTERETLGAAYCPPVKGLLSAGLIVVGSGFGAAPSACPPAPLAS